MLCMEAVNVLSILQVHYTCRMKSMKHSCRWDNECWRRPDLAQVTVLKEEVPVVHKLLGAVTVQGF